MLVTDFYRATQTGWLWLNTTHVVVASLLFLVMLWRKRFPLWFRICVLLFYFAVYGITGMMTFGPANGVPFLTTMAVMCAVFFGYRAGLIGIAACLVSVVGTYGLLQAQVFAWPTLPSIEAAGAWLGILGGTAIIAFCPIVAIVKFAECMESERKMAVRLADERTTLRQAQQVMEEAAKNQARIVALLDDCPIGILVTSLTHRIMYLNEPGGEILGYESAAAIGQRFGLQGFDSTEIEAFLSAADIEGYLAERTLHMQRLGKQAVLNISMRTIQFEGRPAHLYWFFDITDRVEAEKQLRQLNDRFEAVLSVTPDFILLLDRDQRVIVASESVAQLLKQPGAKTMIGKTAREMAVQGASPEANAEILAGASPSS